MKKKSLKETIEKNLAWLATMKQPQGYAGPVVHYWQDCLNYIGPSMGWGYEGLIDAFIALYKKTSQEKFITLAKEAGDHLLRSQLPNGIFFNSHFEANPSLKRGSTPHDTGAALGLAYLAEFLMEKGEDGRKYLAAAKRNLDLYHFGFLYEEKTGLFLQYHYDKQRLHVPNKIATLIELLLLMHKLTKEKKYLDVIKANADYIVQQQDEHTGGIFQTEKHQHIITFYTARCVPALLKVHEMTGKEKYKETAVKAGKFLEKIRESNGYNFGYLKIQQKWKKFTYPIFVAGGADISRALLLLKGKKTEMIEEDVELLQKRMLSSGGIMTSYGMNLKNQSIKSYQGKPFWRDVMPVVGWNDKALRLMAQLLPEGSAIDEKKNNVCDVECADGKYHEDLNKIEINGKNEQYAFYKQKKFSSHQWSLGLVMRIAGTVIGSRKERSLDIKILDYVIHHGWSMKGLQNR